jgi:protein O-GlcNAc transferase
LTKPINSNRDFQGALTALQLGKLGDAERLFKTVLRAEPKHVGALNLIGVVLMQSGRFAEAEDYFCLALQQNAHSDATLYNYGLVLKALNRPAEAFEQFGKALRINASVAETWNNRGTALNDLKRHEEAIADFDKALALSPRYADALYNKGKSLAALGRCEAAFAAFEAALAINSDLAEAWLGRGKMLLERDKHKQALESFDRALALKPDLVEAWLGRANLLFALRRYSDAASAYDRALAFKPEPAQAWAGSGKIAFEHKRYDDAFSAYDRALKLDPSFAEAWVGRGSVSFERQQFDDALADYEKAVSLKPDLAAGLLLIGNVHLEQKRYDKARAAYEEAERLSPDLAEVWLCRGKLFLMLKQFDDAAAAYDKARQLKPDLAEAWSGLATAFNALDRPDDALEAFDRALAIKPDLPEAWLGRGRVFFDLKDYGQALMAYDRALELKSSFTEAWLGRGLTTFYLAQYDQAYLSYKKALTLASDLDYAEGFRLLAKLYLCDWTELESEITQLLSRSREGKAVSIPFVLLALPCTPADLLACTKRFVEDLTVNVPARTHAAFFHDRIRVAYLSADFRDHAVAHLTAGLFEAHDKSRFEITGISLVRGQNAAITSRLTQAFDTFVEISSQTDEEIAAFIQDREIDIAVDLMGHTQHARLGVFARRPAPIQIHYLGYAGTSGTNFIDYILADSTVIPEEQKRFYTEQVVWMPDTYLASDNKRVISARTPTRQECALPEHGFVFCSFNNAYKIAPQMFELWMRLLRAVPDSILWLSQANLIAMNNLARQAERNGISPRRVIFAPKIEQIADHLARQRRADLFLDTLPYNAHTTASDALWAGLPVLTCIGESFAGRVAASLLRAIGLPELITTSLDDYEALALKLAGEPNLLASIRAKLASHRDNHALFDTARFTRHIEAAYTTMRERHQRGEPPQAFAVTPVD